MSTGNRILDALEGGEVSAFRAGLSLVEMKVHDVTAMPDRRFGDVYFPVSCVLSTTIVTDDGDEVEIATIGFEGFDPMSTLLGQRESPYRTVAQVPGSAYRMPLDTFLDWIERSPSLREVSRNFAQAFLQFLSQSIACNRLHPLAERCARWLLMTHDRVRGQEIRLTQEYLAVMLGVRRPAVTIAAQTLAHAGLITYRRGTIRVVDREGLENASCECYAAIRAAYDRAFARDQ